MRILGAVRSTSNAHPLPRQKLLFPEEHAPLLAPRHVPLRPSAPVVGVIDAFSDGRHQESSGTTLSPKPPVFPKSRFYFVPGYLDYMPPRGFLYGLDQAAGLGLAVLMASPDEHYHDDHRFTLAGGRDGYYLPDWRQELPTLVQRLYVDLRETEFKRGKPENLVFIGHSKGGLLLHGLAALARRVEQNNREAYFDVFPGLRAVPLHVIQYVGLALQGARFLAIGTPFDGVGEFVQHLAKVTQFDRFFGGTSQFYHPDFLRGHYAKTGVEPEEMIHAVVTTQPFASDHSPSLVVLLARSALRMANPFRSTVYDGGISLFEVAGFFIAPDGFSDGLVEVSERPFRHREHFEGYNHLTQVGNDMAERVIKLLREIS